MLFVMPKLIYAKYPVRTTTTPLMISLFKTNCAIELLKAFFFYCINQKDSVLSHYILFICVHFSAFNKQYCDMQQLRNTGWSTIGSTWLQLVHWLIPAHIPKYKAWVEIQEGKYWENQRKMRRSFCSCHTLFFFSFADI